MKRLMAYQRTVTEQLLDQIAATTTNFSGADLKALATEACLCCLRRCYPQVYKSHVKLALEYKYLVVSHCDWFEALQIVRASSERSDADAAASSLTPSANALAATIPNDISSCIFKSKLFINGNISDIIMNAVWHKLETLQVFTINLVNLFAFPASIGMCPEAAVAQIISSIRHALNNSSTLSFRNNSQMNGVVVYLPSVDSLFKSIPQLTGRYLIDRLNAPVDEVNCELNYIPLALIASEYDGALYDNDNTSRSDVDNRKLSYAATKNPRRIVIIGTCKHQNYESVPPRIVTPPNIEKRLPSVRQPNLSPNSTNTLRENCVTLFNTPTEKLQEGKCQLVNGINLSDRSPSSPSPIHSRYSPKSSLPTLRTGNTVSVTEPAIKYSYDRDVDSIKFQININLSECRKSSKTSNVHHSPLVNSDLNPCESNADNIHNNSLNVDLSDDCPKTLDSPNSNNSMYDVELIYRNALEYNPPNIPRSRDIRSRASEFWDEACIRIEEEIQPPDLNELCEEANLARAARMSSLSNQKNKETEPHSPTKTNEKLQKNITKQPLPLPQGDRYSRRLHGESPVLELDDIIQLQSSSRPRRKLSSSTPKISPDLQTTQHDAAASTTDLDAPDSSSNVMLKPFEDDASEHFSSKSTTDNFQSVSPKHSDVRSPLGTSPPAEHCRSSASLQVDLKKLNHFLDQFVLQTDGWSAIQLVDPYTDFINLILWKYASLTNRLSLSDDFEKIFATRQNAPNTTSHANF
ncbi:unnamed protein product [Trichobilharzia szidati]|nr:unnamed protein product [Trichobilharzia szidati]